MKGLELRGPERGEKKKNKKSSWTAASCVKTRQTGATHADQIQKKVEGAMHPS